ncbi:hypothetical protein MPLDJ20_170025 [Mesorhizobium plurifarium]|uniref:DUF1828 domain-containing protein n=1 Tax=Mesorhizobium plurifarium TaxID=69974 RepID=A0A090ER50_MESPL|nr:hypothetical protein MPLDJ20_170025 [Mesorhizobium plurifarium]
MGATTELRPGPLTKYGYLEKIAGDLVRLRHSPRGGIITVPVLFPSGSHVTILVSFNGERCLISDDGSAFAEADMMGASEIFRRIARSVASEVGVKFNSFEIFEAEVGAETATGMVAIIADTARRAVELTAERLAKRLEVEARTSVVDKLISVFGKSHVSIDAAISGASAHGWVVDALVRTSSATIAVETVTPSPTSVSSAYVKLDDIRRLESAPRTVAALRNRTAFGSDQLLILGRTARLIDLAATSHEYERLAA